MNVQLIAEYRTDAWMNSGHDPRMVEAEVVVPTAEIVDEGNEQTVLGLVELLLKNPNRVDRLSREGSTEPMPMLTRLLGIAQASYLLFGVSMVLILNCASTPAGASRLIPIPPARMADGSALALLLAYCLGLTATTCICLPSFYFFSLLAGVRMTFLQIASQVVRCKANSAIVLLGILPIYVAVMLGLAVFKAPAPWVEWCIYIGLTLPFVAGLEGVRAIYRGVMGLAETLPPERRCRRECFLRRLTLSWAAVYTVVAPLMIYRLWENLAVLFS